MELGRSSEPEPLTNAKGLGSEHSGGPPTAENPLVVESHNAFFLRLKQ
jgi:hypothetical protein